MIVSLQRLITYQISQFFMRIFIQIMYQVLQTNYYSRARNFRKTQDYIVIANIHASPREIKVSVKKYFLNNQHLC